MITKETESFQIAYRRIRALLDKLERQGVCGCCTGRALLASASWLCEETMGSEEAARLLHHQGRFVDGNNRPAPDYQTHH